MYSDKYVRLLRCFLCTGITALLIAVSHLAPSLWPLSLVALMPFLWRIINGRGAESALMGMLLAVIYCSLVAPPPATEALPGWIMQVAAFGAVLAVYASIINLSANHLGSNSLLLALLWVPLEYGLKRVGEFDCLFAYSIADSDILLRIGSLFGALMISFLIILVNLLLVTELARVVTARPPQRLCPGPVLNHPLFALAIDDSWTTVAWVPGLRAPPRRGCIRGLSERNLHTKVWSDKI